MKRGFSVAIQLLTVLSLEAAQKAWQTRRLPSPGIQFLCPDNGWLLFPQPETETPDEDFPGFPLFSPWEPVVQWDNEQPDQLVLTFSPPGVRARRCTVKLIRGSFLPPWLTVDMTEAWCRYPQADHEKKLKIATKKPWGRVQALADEHTRYARMCNDFRRQCGSDAARMAQVYGTIVAVRGSEKLLFFTCRALIEGKVIPFEVEVANVCDLDSWLVLGKDNYRLLDQAEQYIESIDIEYLE